MTAHQEGIAAHKEGKGRHENPYIGYSQPIIFRNEWDAGWDAEDLFQNRKRIQAEEYYNYR